MSAHVIAVARSATHDFSKPRTDGIRLLAGLGVEHDSHQGEKVKHLFRVRQDPSQPNLRQVHLMQAELFDELAPKGFAIAPGDLGENITTRGIDVLGLPAGARLRIGHEAVVEVTGLRNPCRQIEAFRPGLLAAVLDRDEAGNLVRKTGIMAIVLTGGPVCEGDRIEVELPPLPHRKLAAV